MTTIQNLSTKTNHELIIKEIINEFEKKISLPLRFKKYTKTKMVEKTKEWNYLAIELLKRIKEEKIKDELAYEFTTIMINKTMELVGEHPFIDLEIEERFIRKTIMNQK